MERLYMDDPNRITYSSMKERDDRFKKPFNAAFRRDRKKDYRDYDEPEPDKERTSKPAGSSRSVVNFLDI